MSWWDEEPHPVGANFAVASTGEIVVCTNEGNADMGTSQPKLQIAAFGMEKIVTVVAIIVSGIKKKLS